VAVVVEIDAAEARRLRARAHALAGSALSPSEVVARAIAFQGQDLAAVLSAIALRSAPGTVPDDVRSAFDRGELVRGWPMRGTLFATTPDDLAGLLSLTGERVRAAAARRRAALGLDAATIDRAREVALEALATGPVSRDDLAGAWNAAGIATDGGRGYHLIFHLAVEGLVHWGPFRGNEQLLARTPSVPVEPSDAVLSRVARGYLVARGPATLDDLAWWTKLPKTLLRPAVEALDGLERVAVEGRAMLRIDDGLGGDAPHVVLVPGFDEWVLGYQDRSLVATGPMLDALVPGGNGVFRPAILLDGRVVGTWLAPGGRRKSAVAELVEDVSARDRKAIDAALAELAAR